MSYVGIVKYFLLLYVLLLKCETSRFAAGLNPSNCVKQAIVVERCVAQSKSGLTIANIISTGNILAIANISILANSSACGNCKGVEREEKSQPKVFVKDELFYLLFIYLVREVSV